MFLPPKRPRYVDEWEAEAAGVTCLICEAVGLEHPVEVAASSLVQWYGSLNHLQALVEFVLGGRSTFACDRSATAPSA